MPCRATRDGQVMVENSENTWSMGGGNGKWFQYTYCENPMNYIRRQKDTTARDVIRVGKTCTDSCCFPTPLPNPKGWMLWPYSFHFIAWCEIRAKTGLTAETEQGTWGVIQASCRDHCQCVLGGTTRQAVGRHWILGRQMLGQSTQRFLFQQECPDSAHSIQLGTRSGKHRFWEKSATKAAQTPWRQKSPQFLQCSTSVPVPAYSTPQLYTRSGADTAEKGKWLWAAPESNHGCWHRRCIGSLWPHGAHLLQQSPPLRQGTHSRTREPDWRQPSGFLLQ